MCRYERTAALLFWRPGSFDLSGGIPVIACAGVTTAVVINQRKACGYRDCRRSAAGAISGLVNSFVIAS